MFVPKQSEQMNSLNA